MIHLHPYKYPFWVSQGSDLSFACIPSTWHNTWFTANTHNILVEFIHFGWELFQSSTRIGTKVVMGKRSRSGSTWLHYSIVLLVSSSFRVLYTGLSFCNTENLGFFASPSCCWNRNCLKEQLSNSSGSCGLEGAARMRFLMTRRLQWGCYNFTVTH